MPGKTKGKQKRDFGIDSIEIEKFRNFKPMTINLGRYITVVSGQNGTGKSTLLGMLGQPFGLVDKKDVFGRSMRAKFTDMFKLSPEHDAPGEHIYYVNLRDQDLYQSGAHVQVKSYKRDGYKLPIRLVTGARRGKGDGNIDYPVIYLGLRRTYPVGEIPNAASTAPLLTVKEVKQLNKWDNAVFLSWRQDDLEPVKLTASTAKKATILVNTQSYDYLANSAGQDNLGQILAALLSFGRVKDELGDAYRGGLLLIDELDATLFPASQEALFSLLLSAAIDLEIQVVFTTHSFQLIEQAIAKRGKLNDVQVAYFRRRDDGIELVDSPDMIDVLADLTVKMPDRPKKTKVEVLCEDDEAKWFLKMILPRAVYSKCNVISAGLGCGELGELSIREIPSLSNSLFVVDGDAVKNACAKVKNSSRLCILPTGVKNPETAIYDTLAELPDNGEFWTSMELGFHYSRQMFIRSYEESHGAYFPDDKAKRRADKSWFKSEKSRGGLGENGKEAFRQWKSMNQEECDRFVSAFSDKVDRTIRRVEAMVKMGKSL